jgi:uncharacterized protein
MTHPIGECSAQPGSPMISQENTRTLIDEVCRLIPPLWPLKDFVAVNPFLGLSDRPFLQAASLLRQTAHGDILMPEAYYLQRLNQGDITDQDIREAVHLARITLPSPWSDLLKNHTVESLRRKLTEKKQNPDTMPILSVSDCVDHFSNTNWSVFITEEISKWCSVYFDEGQSSWRMPWRHLPFFSAWKEAARHDANPGLCGLKLFRKIVKELPKDPCQAIHQTLQALEIPIHLQASFLHRQLLSIAGWSSYAQYQTRLNPIPEAMSGLAELLAVRLAYDWCLREQYRNHPGFESFWQSKLQSTQISRPDPGLLDRYLLQLSLEKSYQRKLTNQLLTTSSRNKSEKSRPRVHAIFCIDVRSEVYRRHLEGQDDEIITSGFAGFFGMLIEHLSFGQSSGTPQCPVLFAPKFKVRDALKNGDDKAENHLLDKHLFRKHLSYAWNSFKTSAISCFSFVETSGLLFGFKLGRDALALKSEAPRHDSGRMAPELKLVCSPATGSDKQSLSVTGIPPSDRIDMAEGALRNLGLNSGFARLILFCGHGSATNNNPYASGLDCGACGGHAGHVNARVAAAILNDPDVREGLKTRGIVIPSDTHFLAGLHTTTTDDVFLFDPEDVPTTHRDDWKKLSLCLAQASHLTREERASRLGLDRGDRSLDHLIKLRSRDWSQTRPEWGLANNAALIVAPRERTKGLNLDGRTFLHDYQSGRDPGNKVLELILTAPVVVANWINLQYYASTVNNSLFGSGNKTIHNVVGALGIWQGNGGDLQTGLPLQSLHDGRIWRHEPLRLSVYVEAPRSQIDQILLKHRSVRDLVENQWLYLFALEPGEQAIYQCHRQGHWSDGSPGRTSEH